MKSQSERDFPSVICRCLCEYTVTSHPGFPAVFLIFLSHFLPFFTSFSSAAGFFLPSPLRTCPSILPGALFRSFFLFKSVKISCVIIQIMVKYVVPFWPCFQGVREQISDGRRCVLLVHLGHGRAVQDRDILLMTDLTASSGIPPWNLSEDTAKLVSRLEEKGRVEKLGETPQSLVICCKKDGSTNAYLTSTGMRTLRLRLKNGGCAASDNFLQRHAASSANS